MSSTLAFPRPRSNQLAGNLLDAIAMLKPEIRIYQLELEQPWAIASRLGPSGQGIAQRTTVFLKLEDESGNFGYGEAAPVSTYGESPLSVLRFLREFDWSRIAFGELEESLSYLHSGTPGNNAAKAAIDIALHDGAARSKSQSVGQLLGLSSGSDLLPPTAYSIGIASPEEVRLRAQAAERFPIIKMKAGPSDLEEALKAFRSVSPTKPLRIDGNEAWKSREEALRAIETIEGYGPIEFVEQPMPRDTSLANITWLKDRSPLPMVADESCRTLSDLDYCVAGFDGVNVKLAKSGGIAKANQLLAAAKKRGLRTQLGCMIESSLGIAAALNLASQVDWIDLDGAMLTRNDPFQGLHVSEGKLSKTGDGEAFGVGVTPRSNLWTTQVPETKPTENRSLTPPAQAIYGHSVNGVPLEVHLPKTGDCQLLIFAAIHGEEPETTTLLSKALRTLDGPSPNCAVVLCANPDGTLLGTRGNARGVELNRNFPASNWQSEPVTSKWSPNHGRVSFSTGSKPGSEPETRALIDLVEALSPQTTIALHAPLACIDDPEYSRLGYWLSRRTSLPLVGNIGYETPGSFGSWAKENDRHVITYELPPLSVSALHEKHLENLVGLLRHGLRAIESDSSPSMMTG